MKPTFGIFVSSLVSAIIFLSAGGIVYGVAKEEHSSPQLIAQGIQRLNHQWETSGGALAGNSDAVQIADISNLPAEYQALVKNSTTLPDTTDTHAVLGVTSENCADVEELIQAQQYGSIVNYLEMQGESAKFEDRLQLAMEVGIEEYSGTAQQNVQLLSFVKEKDQQKIQVCTEE